MHACLSVSPNLEGLRTSWEKSDSIFWESSPGLAGVLAELDVAVGGGCAMPVAARLLAALGGPDAFVGGGPPNAGGGPVRGDAEPEPEDANGGVEG